MPDNGSLFDGEEIESADKAAPVIPGIACKELPRRRSERYGLAPAYGIERAAKAVGESFFYFNKNKNFILENDEVNFAGTAIAVIFFDDLKALAEKKECGLLFATGSHDAIVAFHRPQSTSKTLMPASSSSRALLM